MTRQKTFDSEEIEGMRGLTSLTEPGEEDRVGAVVDVAVIGARGDGKTQFIVHAIRTLRAYAPPLEGVEHQYNRDVLQVVMSAREPRPEATPPGVVPHYVFRIRPDSLLSQVGLPGRLTLYARVAGLWFYGLLSLLNASLVGVLLSWLRGGPDAASIGSAVGLFAVGVLVGAFLSRRQFMRRGDIEIVFWDVAGEHVYSASAADYYSFLSALVRQRRERASEARSYAFAPVLLCNPLSLGTRIEGSPYARLRQLMPLFASLNEPLPRAMVAINRWTVVKEVCTPDANRDDVVAVAARARIAHAELDDAELDGAGVGSAKPEGSELGGARADSAKPGSTRPESSELDSARPDSAQPPDGQAEQNRAESLNTSETQSPTSNGQTAGTDRASARNALPVVERDVVRKHCLDAEDGAGDGDDRDIHFSYLRYDAGIQCEFRERKWDRWDSLPGPIKTRWRAPTRANPDTLLEYIYEDGPGSFRGEVRRSFLNWLAGLAFHPASYGQARTRQPAHIVAPLMADPDMADPEQPTWPVAMKSPVARVSAEHNGHVAHGAEDTREPIGAEHDPAPSERPELVIVDQEPGDVQGDMWTPRPLSAEGLEEFARGTIAPVSPYGEPAPIRAGSLAEAVEQEGWQAEPNRPTDRSPGGADQSAETLPEVAAEPLPEVAGDVAPRAPNEPPSEPADGGQDFVRESTAPGIGPGDSGPHSEVDSADDAAQGKSRARRQGDTIPVSGGFGSSGT
ncbi:MAG: hypothetical protein MJE77_44465 [Proteobacteria bacterium]|nr:hypothetical protein [Pseudomonadota bacterium]